METASPIGMEEDIIQIWVEDTIMATITGTMEEAVAIDTKEMVMEEEDEEEEVLEDEETTDTVMDTAGTATGKEDTAAGMMAAAVDWLASSAIWQLEESKTMYLLLFPLC